MTLTAHVPVSTGTQTFEMASTSRFASLGDRLVQLGLALQNSDSTAGELEQLARACGIGLHLKLVEGE